MMTFDNEAEICKIKEHFHSARYALINSVYIYAHASDYHNMKQF